ncbi:MAG: FAD-binding oxidoreductase [Pseudomonadota bacterium]
MKVARLPVDPGPAAWNALLPEPEAPTPLEGKATADWLVIGAGLAGLAAARRLSLTQPGDRIAVLDAVRVGEGPAGRNSGFMIDLPHDLTSENYGGNLDADHAQIRANRAAIDFAMEAATAYDLPEEAIVRSGKINAAASARGLRHNEGFARHLTALDEVFELYDAAQMQEITGTEYYAGGLYTPHSAMIQPAMFVRGVSTGLRSNRVSIHEQSPVTGLARDGHAWVATTARGQMTAPRVILAVNGHAESFGYFRRHLVHIFTWASMTRAMSSDEVRRLGGHPRWGATPADPLGTTVRRISGTGGDRIVVRNRAHYAADMEPPKGWLETVTRQHDRSFAARFPMLQGVEMEHRWGGRLCLSLNDAPAFGEVDEGLFAACCQNGLGTARGTFAGVAAADLAVGRETEFTAAMAAKSTPRRLPPEPFAWLGATARIRLGERAAGAEL